MPALAGSDAGTASQLIPGVRRTHGQRNRRDGLTAWPAAPRAFNESARQAEPELERRLLGEFGDVRTDWPTASLAGCLLTARLTPALPGYPVLPRVWVVLARGVSSARLSLAGFAIAGRERASSTSCLRRRTRG